MSFEPNSILLFGLLLLGGFLSGEASRRGLGLPRTTGYVVFGLVIGKSGFEWVGPYIAESARFFIDLALGLILFELGHRVPVNRAAALRPIVAAGIAESVASFTLISGCLLWAGFPPISAMFAAAIGVSTSPAITIATSSDVGGRGPKTDALFTLVAVNGAVAFCATAVLVPLLNTAVPFAPAAALAQAASTISVSLGLGCALSWLAVIGARWLGPHPEHQHLLLLGLIVAGIGTATSLDMSGLLALLSFGVFTRVLDRDERVVAIRISSNARIFLVVTFVLAGAVLEAGLLPEVWAPVALFVVARMFAKGMTMYLLRSRLHMSGKDSIHTGLGLLPMSSVALVLLADARALDATLDSTLNATVLSAILLMQLVGPIATQTAIRGFDEAGGLVLDRRAGKTGAA